MARYRRRSSTTGRARRLLREKGLIAIAVGTGLWAMSFVLSGAGPMGGAAQGLHLPATGALGIGAVLLAIDAWLHRTAGHSPPPEAGPEPDVAASSTPHRPDGDTATPRLTAVPAQARADRPASQPWSTAVFDAIEWRRFEAVCEALFAQAGFETRSQSHGADGGVDIWLHSRNASGPVSVVQCKHWRGKPVGVKEMREFFGVMISKGLKRGTYATSSTFTADATSFAQGHGIHLLDGAALLHLIEQRTPEQQQALLTVAFEGDYARPTCANCGVKMVERASRHKASLFWGCKNYPRCRSTLPMRASFGRGAG